MPLPLPPPRGGAAGGGGRPRGWVVRLCWFTLCILKRPHTQLCLTQSHSEGARRSALWGYFGLGIIGNYYILRLRGDVPPPGGPQAAVGVLDALRDVGPERGGRRHGGGRGRLPCPPGLQMAPDCSQEVPPEACRLALGLGAAGRGRAHRGAAQESRHTQRVLGVRRTHGTSLPVAGVIESLEPERLSDSLSGTPAQGTFFWPLPIRPDAGSCPDRTGRGLPCPPFSEVSGRAQPPHGQDAPPRTVSSPVPWPVSGGPCTPP